MKKLFILPLFYLALVSTLPLQVQATELDTLDIDVQAAYDTTTELCSKIKIDKLDIKTAEINKLEVKTAEIHKLDVKIAGIDKLKVDKLKPEFIEGVYSVETGMPNAIPVLIDSNGQLGTRSSSIRYKTNVENINEKSAALLDLRPVSYTYKADSTNTIHFGFVAEEVNDILPLVVIRDGAGAIETIRYEDVIALLVNELIKINARLTLVEEQISY